MNGGWLFYSLLALLCWGFWAFLPKVAVRYLPARAVFLWEVVGGLVVAAFVLATLRERAPLEWRGVLPAVLTGILGYLGVVFFISALQSGKVSIVATLTAVYPAITIFLGVVLLGERLSGWQVTGAALALVGLLLLTRG